MTISQPTRRRDAREHRRAFPLISIVQLSTFCVATVTCVDFKALARAIERVPTTQWYVVVAPIVATAIVGLLTGGMIGLGQIRKWQGFVLCATTGATVSVLLLAAFAAPAPPAQGIAAVLLPLVSTIIVRHRTS